MKKVLLLIPKDSSFLPPIAKYFREKKWQTAVYDYRKGSLPIRFLRFTPIIGGFQKAATRIFDDILNVAKVYKPNLIFVIKGENLGPDFLEEIKREIRNAILINWFPDPINQWDLMVKISSHYDFYFDSDPQTVSMLKKIGRQNVHNLPFAAEVEELTDFDKKFDVSFIGTFSPYRENYLKALTPFSLNIWGDPRWFNSHLKNFVRGGRIGQKEMKDIIKRSKININIHHNVARSGTNLRTFEVVGSGGFLLSEYMPDLKRLFKIDEEIVCFKNKQELKAKVDYFLKNEKERVKIAAQGFQKVRSTHSYNKRLDELLSIIKLG